MISIKRIYLNSGMEVEILINPRYIIRIEPTNPSDGKPNTRIVMEGYTKDETSIIYTNSEISTIKGKITNSKKRN